MPISIMPSYIERTIETNGMGLESCFIVPLCPLQCGHFAAAYAKSFVRSLEESCLEKAICMARDIVAGNTRPWRAKRLSFRVPNLFVLGASTRVSPAAAEPSTRMLPWLDPAE